MPEVFTITLNPALDVATETEEVAPGRKLRCAAPQVDPGGGGINVSRAIRQLGGESMAFAALGGPTGARLSALLAAEGIAHLAHDGPGETRQSVAVTETATGAQYRFVLPGPDWHESDGAALLETLAEQVPQDAFVILSGSQPPGLAEDFPHQLVEALAPRAARVIVDTSGAAMRALQSQAGARPFALRLDDAEARALTGSRIDTVADLAVAATGLVARGVAENVLLALGAEGSVLASADRGAIYHSQPPQRAVVSAVGAGDSFMGGFALALARGESREEALRHGTAAACAAVVTEGTQLCTKADFDAILPETTLTHLWHLWPNCGTRE